MKLKEILYNHCVTYVNQRLSICQSRMDSLQNDLASETKSSAGDKHETGRAMLHLEREKLGHQLGTIEQEKNILDHFNPILTQETVRLGSIVKTTHHHYFILISAGVVKVAQDAYIAISPQAPIGQLLMGKTAGDKINFRDNSFTITQVS